MVSPDVDEDDGALKRIVVEVDGGLKRQFEIAILQINNSQEQNMKQVLTRMIGNYIRYETTKKTVRAR